MDVLPDFWNVSDPLIEWSRREKGGTIASNPRLGLRSEIINYFLSSFQSIKFPGFKLRRKERVF